MKTYFLIHNDVIVKQFTSKNTFEAHNKVINEEKLIGKIQLVEKHYLAEWKKSNGI